MAVMSLPWQRSGRVMNSGRLMRFFLLLINLLLLFLLVWFWQSTPQLSAAENTPSNQLQPVSLPVSPLRSLSLVNYQELLARPLFWSERRALQSAATGDATTQNQPLAYVLNGVVTSPQSSYALLSKPGGTEVIKAQPGDVVEGWEIESMTSNSVTLKRSGQRQRIMLDEEQTKGR